jgi:hypothetical protein
MRRVGVSFKDYAESCRIKKSMVEIKRMGKTGGLGEKYYVVLTIGE